jgi:hypothetical protein
VDDVDADTVEVVAGMNIVDLDRVEKKNRKSVENVA